MASTPAGVLRLGAMLLAVLIAGCLGFFGYAMARLRAQALESGLALATTQARNFEEHLTQTLGVVDLVMANLEPGTKGVGAGADFGAQARAALRPAPYLRSLSLVDASGRVIGSSSDANLGAVFARDSVFPAGEIDAEVLRVGAPQHGRDVGDGQSTSAPRPLTPADLNIIPVLRRLPPASGEPPRWVLAAINPEYFINHFTQLLEPRTGRVQWLRYDGLLLASSGQHDLPGVPGQAGAVAEALRQREFGRLEQKLADETEVLTAYRASSRFPVLVAVHVDREAVLASWRAESQQLALVVLPALAALAVAGAMALRRHGQLTLKQAELHQQNRLTASVFDAIGEAIVLTTPGGEIISCNPAYLSMTGYSMAEVLGRTLAMISTRRHEPDFYRAMWAQIAREGRWQGELVNRRKDGSLFNALVSINTVHDTRGRLQHYVGVTRDITERKRAEAAERDAERKLQQQATEKLLLMERVVRDSLTGLYNRRYLDETLPRELARVRREGHPLAVVMVDIDHFKHINDSHGHAAGDEVIRAMACTLGNGTREGDVVCRHGGEEFVVVMPGMDLEAAMAKAERWRLAAAALCVRHGTAEIHFTISAGVAIFPAQGSDAATLLHCADLAMYQSKSAGRNRVTRSEGDSGHPRPQAAEDRAFPRDFSRS
jgi:diguanylate cyclase (GGDEF)-like protein/PAS domain S-box-containing protein